MTPSNNTLPFYPYSPKCFCSAQTTDVIQIAKNNIKQKITSCLRCNMSWTSLSDSSSLFLSPSHHGRRKSINILITEISSSNLKAKKKIIFVKNTHTHTKQTPLSRISLVSFPKCLCLSYVLYTCSMISFLCIKEKTFLFFDLTCSL